MKFIKAFVAVILIVGLAIWAIGAYLGPDDLKGCEGKKPSNEKGCQAADAIVAISGGDTAARADEAIMLYKNGWAPFIIFSGAAADKSGPSNALVMKQQAIDAGIEPGVIIIEESSETTDQNATATTSIFASRHITSAILVTSAYHERRALLEFNRRALDVEVRAHPVAHDKQWTTLWWTTPTGWALAIPELIRSLVLSTGGIDR
jgi:uncharacterized SAM-binding protein YcdF (DUF218 family)